MGELFRMDMEDGAYMMGLFEGHPPRAPTCTHAHSHPATPPPCAAPGRTGLNESRDAIRD